MNKPQGPRRHTSLRAVRFCAWPACRETVGAGYVCGSHWRLLPVILQRGLTGARGPERHAAERAADDWIKNRTLVPTTAAVPAFHEPKDPIA